MAAREIDAQDAGDLWEERMQALEAIFGKADDGVLHAPIPLFMGGGADVLSFSKYRGVKLYVTADPTGSGQKPNSGGEYELAVAHRDGETWGADIISQMAIGTMDEVFEDGHTMDIGPAVPEGSTIAAVLFKRIGRFTLRDKPANVLCMVGITKEELSYKSANGSAMLLDQLPPDYILTDLNRPTFVKSWFGRLWDSLRG